MSTYTGDNIKDLDVDTPIEGSVGTIPEFNDAIRETKRVYKYQNAITTITGDTTLDKTYSTVKINKATAIAVTLPTASTVASAAFIKKYYLQNIGAGVATINATVTLAGTATASPTMAQWDEMRIWTDGTTWYGVKYSATPAANTVPVRNAAGNLSFRGALVKRITTSFSITSTVPTAIEFNGEEYDSDNIHDNSTNPSRLTVPTGVTKVRLKYQYRGTGTGLAGTSPVQVLQKNGSVFLGSPWLNQIVSTTILLSSGISPIILVTGGDYFEVVVTLTGTDPIIPNDNDSWFGMEIIE